MGKRQKYKNWTIEDLYKVYYGPNLDGKNVSANEIKQYENRLRTKLISKRWREREVKQIFSYLGEVETVPESNHKKTSDFKIEDEKLIIEVTSINTAPAGEQDENGCIPLNLPLNEDAFIEKINRGIEHAEEKEDTLGYSKIAVIYNDPVMLGLKPDFMKKLFDSDFIRKTGFLSSSLDGLVFLPPKLAILGGDSDIKIPGPICYVKGQEMVDLVSKISELEVKLLEDEDGARR